MESKTFPIGSSKGFSLIGVLTSAAVGLVVVSGISQMFVNMAGQIRGIEQRTATRQFHSTLGTHISQPGICVNTLQDYGKWIHKGNPSSFSFSKIINQKGKEIKVLDLSLAENQKTQRQIYGMDGHVSYQLSCLGKADSNGNFDKVCDCRTATWDYTANGPCQKLWRFNLLFQSRQNGVLVYQKPFSYDIQVEYSKAPQTVKNGAGQDRAQANLSCNSQISPFVSEDGNPNDLLRGPGGNVFAGHGAGATNRTSLEKGEGNVFVGYLAGQKNSTGRDNTFIGTLAGRLNTTGDQNMFIGEATGTSNTTGNTNTFVGHSAGRLNETGLSNTFVGAYTGHHNDANFNTFVGQGSGFQNTTGVDNSFFGYHAGQKNTTGVRNVFVGVSAGKLNTTGEHNTCIGYRACDWNTGSRNIIIGYQAESSDLTADDAFVVGNAIGANSRWLTGTIGGSSLKVKGQETVNASSRTLKKNISEFFDFEEALQDILGTPLFNYSYREAALHPEKQRMGLIAEELPDRLRLPGEDYPHPDWPSIYGTLWAGIKALHRKLETLFTDNTELKQELKRANERMETLMSLTATTSKQLEKAHQEIEILKKELEELKK